MGERNDSCTLAVLRRKLLLHTVQKLKRLFTDLLKPFRLQIIGEAGVVAGGPTKDFFSLVFNESQKFLVCSGNGTGFTLLHDVEKVRKGDFRLFGNLVAVGTFMECAGSQCFIPTVTAHLLNGEELHLKLEAIPGFDIQRKVQDLISAANEEGFQERLESFSERYLFGVTNVHVSLEDCDQLVKYVTQHFYCKCLNKNLMKVKWSYVNQVLIFYVCLQPSNTQKQMSNIVV